MRVTLYLVLLTLALFCGEWIYRSFVRAVDPPTAQMIALAEHFNAVGIRGHIYPVRHGYRHSRMTAAAAFQIDGYPLPISFSQSPNEAAAMELFQAVQLSPNLTHAQRNGVLVLNLPMWGDDTGPMTEKVTNAFASFKPEI